MMFPEATLRLLTKEESVVLRKCLANLLYACELNKAERGMDITYVIHFRGAQICFDPMDSLDMTVKQTRAYIAMNLEIYPSYNEETELLGRLPRGTDFIPIRSDDELKRFLKNYVDRGIDMVDVKVEVVNV